MKKIILTTIFFLASNLLYSQVYKWRSSVSSSRQTLDGYWTQWSDWATSGVLIVAEPKNQRVKVYSATPQTYDMIEAVTVDYDKDNNPIYSVICIDEGGVKCKMVWYHTADSGSYVIFYFSNLELMFRVVQLD